MNNPKVAVFDVKPHDREFFDHVNKKYNLDITYFDQQLSLNTIECARGYSAVCIFVHDIITSNLIDLLYQQGTRLIALRCAGCDNVDIAAARGKIKIINVPAYSPYAVAEYTIGLIISLNRKIHRAAQKTRDNNFSIEHLMGFDLHGKTAGIIGAGLIGSLVIQYLHSFGMRVLACDPHPDKIKQTPAIATPLQQLLTESDIVSLHCTLKKENHHSMNAQNFAAMKRGSLFINTARGELVDTKALIDAIDTKHLAGAALDVYEHEKLIFYKNFSEIGIADNLLARLLSYPQVIISSHQAFFTREAVTSIVETTLHNINAFYEGRPLSHELL